jgi:uncharacterized protein (DUF1501 family)
MKKQNPFRTGNDLTRRDFLRASGGCAALTSTSLLSTILNLQLTRSAAAAVNPDEYRAMVCLFLHGGNDSFNMLVPTDPDAYEAYALARGNLALAPESLLGITDAFDGRGYGLHPGMPELQSLYQSGALGFVGNVGTLVEPTTRDSYGNGAALPLGLFSHSDQQRHWQTSVPQSRTQITGWVGRMADMLGDTINSNPAISINIAMEHLNILQTGNDVIPYVVDDRNGAELLSGYRGTNARDRILTRATDSLIEETYGDLLKKTHARMRRSSVDAALDYKQLTDAVQFNTVFPDTPIGRSLHQAAKAIGARQGLGQKRQVFFVERGGWDHHDGVLARQEVMLPEVSQGLKAFHDATVEMGLADKVVTFSISDFARTLSSNGNGSDHAWGGHQIVMGGGMLGGVVHGAYPESLAPGNELDLGRGRLLPSVSVDEYNAELAMWFGIDNGPDLEAILPNLRNFYASGSSAPPLGLFG